MEATTMVSLYEVVIAVILLFPWSLVITVAVGALWTKASTCAVLGSFGSRGQGVSK